MLPYATLFVMLAVILSECILRPKDAIQLLNYLYFVLCGQASKFMIACRMPIVCEMSIVFLLQITYFVMSLKVLLGGRFLLCVVYARVQNKFIILLSLFNTVDNKYGVTLASYYCIL